jgi:hypothetical protein
MAVRYLAYRSAILPRDAHRLLPLLDKPALIHHPDRLRMVQARRQIRLKVRGHGGIVPAGVGQHSLQGTSRDGDRFGNILRIAPFLALHEQPTQVIPRALLPLLAPQMRRELPMKREKRLLDPFKLLWPHASLPGRSALRSESQIPSL